MTNHEMAITVASNLESNPVYMALITRYENNPESLTPKEIDLMFSLAESMMPSFEEMSLLNELGFFDED